MSRTQAKALIQALPGILEKYQAALMTALEGKTGRKILPGASFLRKTGATVRNLQRGLTGNRTLAGSAYFSNDEFLEAYLFYYWPVSFVETYLALTELMVRGLLSQKTPLLSSCRASKPRILDLGAGPGPASFACSEFFEGASATLIDSNDNALEMARKIAGQRLRQQEAPLEPQVPRLDALNCVECNLEEMGSPGSEKAFSHFLTKKAPGPYDIIVACHSLNELWQGELDAVEKRASLLEQASTQLAEGGILLVIEPAATVTGRPSLALRDRLLEGNGPDGSRFFCIAPCPGSFSCPALEAGPDRSCHSTWLWDPPELMSGLAREAGLDRNSAKATWFALVKCAPGCLFNASGIAQDKPDENAVYRGRVVSEALLNKAGRIRYIFCAAGGLVTISAHSGDPHAQELGFFSLERGDIIEAERLEVRPGERNFGIGAKTNLSVMIKNPDARRLR